MANASSDVTVALLVAVISGAVGARLTAPHERPAGAAFVYTPPAGFVPADPERDRALLGDLARDSSVWLRPGADKDGYVPRVTVVHTSKHASFDDDDMDHAVKGMPEMFAQDGVVWSEVRHGSHVRPDGARYGLIEGDCKKGPAHYRTLQLAFPDDTGASIVTASFSSEAAPTWEPIFEASVEGAKGIARRSEPPPLWMYIVWGVGAGIMTMVGMRAGIGKGTT